MLLLFEGRAVEKGCAVQPLTLRLPDIFCRLPFINTRKRVTITPHSLLFLLMATTGQIQLSAAVMQIWDDSTDMELN